MTGPSQSQPPTDRTTTGNRGSRQNNPHPTLAMSPPPWPPPCTLTCRRCPRPLRLREPAVNQSSSAGATHESDLVSGQSQPTEDVYEFPLVQSMASRRKTATA